MKAILLAAGVGKRLWPVTQHHPKCLIELGGRTLLRRLIESSWPTALLLDETVTQRTEECMAIVRGGRVVALTKQMPSRYDLAGEGVGFLKVQRADTGHMIDSLKTCVDRGELDKEYE